MSDTQDKIHADSVHGGFHCTCGLEEGNPESVLKELVYALERCLNPDGSWGDMPAAYKRTLLDAAKKALDVYRDEDPLAGDSWYTR